MSASFYASPTIGATTTVAVFFHEIPHEVGDFALLIQSGFSKRAAMASQFVTAIGALMGTLIGIAVQEFGSGGADGEAMPRNGGLWGTSLVRLSSQLLFPLLLHSSLTKHLCTRHGEICYCLSPQAHSYTSAPSPSSQSCWRLVPTRARSCERHLPSSRLLQLARASCCTFHGMSKRVRRERRAKSIENRFRYLDDSAYGSSMRSTCKCNIYMYDRLRRTWASKILF